MELRFSTVGLSLQDKARLRLTIEDQIRPSLGCGSKDEAIIIIQGMEHLGALHATKAGNDLPVKFVWIDCLIPITFALPR